MPLPISIAGLPAKLQSRAVAALIGALVLVVIAGGGFWFGYDYKAGKVAQAENKELRDTQEHLQSEIMRGNDLSAQLEASKAAHEIKYRELREEIKRVTDKYKPSAGAAAVPLP